MYFNQKKKKKEKKRKKNPTKIATYSSQVVFFSKSAQFVEKEGAIFFSHSFVFTAKKYFALKLYDSV